MATWAAAAGLDLSHRRSRGCRRPGHRLRIDAVGRRRHPLRLDAFRPRHRPRRRHRPRGVDVSPSPREGRNAARGPHRGVSYWEASDGADRRILTGSPDGRLFALDARTGRSRAGVRRGRRGRPARGRGGRLAQRAVRGVVAAGDLPRPRHHRLAPAGISRPRPRGRRPRLRRPHGALVWRFHTVPRPGQPGHDTWEGESWKGRSGVNVWSVMSVDTERGLVFLPVGSATYDFYGGDRKGANLYANSVVALEAATGLVRWDFQTVHHDLWDYDLPAQPALVTVRRDGRDVPAVAQVTKTGFVFVLDRETGRPLFPVEERPVPASTVPGEAASPTQPIPLRPPPLVRQSITREQLSTVTPGLEPDLHGAVRQRAHRPALHSARGSPSPSPSPARSAEPPGPAPPSIPCAAASTSTSTRSAPSAGCCRSAPARPWPIAARAPAASTRASGTRTAGPASSHPGARSTPSTSTRAASRGRFRSGSWMRWWRAACLRRERRAWAAPSRPSAASSSSPAPTMRACARSTRTAGASCGRTGSKRAAMRRR